MELTKEQEEVVLKMVAEKIFAEIKETCGGLGDKFGVSIKVAARVSGWNELWIRRNLSHLIMDAEGQHDEIQLGDLFKAMDDRKGGKAA